eukprot:1443000-Lingulodinium_polyedra.AAC.1
MSPSASVSVAQRLARELAVSVETPMRTRTTCAWRANAAMRLLHANKHLCQGLACNTLVFAV